MKTIKLAMFAAAAIAAMAMMPAPSFGQTNLNFNGLSANVEGAIRLSWNSTSNEIYEVDYADSLIDTNTGLITWNVLYTDYPSHGTNTFVGDFGAYSRLPAIVHPSQSPARFYRIALTGTNTANTPSIAITSPTNGATASGLLTVSVTVASDFPIRIVKLYVDGQQMRSSPDGTNFVINTCEWPNGPHTLFATVKTMSDFSGLPNLTDLPVSASAASPYVNVTFDNLITRIAFSQPFFDPADGQTQHVSATFAANVDWELDIQDANSNTVRTVSDSGGTLAFDWDGTGDGGTNIPNGNYTYLISAVTNGLALPLIDGGGGGGDGPPSFEMARRGTLGGDEPLELWALAPESDSLVPWALYPPGFDTNGFTIFAQPVGWRATSSLRTSAARSLSSGGTVNALDANTPTGQESRGPTRPPTEEVKGFMGTFGVGYQTYTTASGQFYTQPILKTPPPIISYVSVDGRPSNLASSPEKWGSVAENKDLGDSFIAGMQSKGWKMTVNKTENDLHGSDLTGGTFNACNVALLSLHTSYATTAEVDGILHTYIRFLNNGSPSYVKTDSCSFGGSGTNGLKFLGFLACNLLRPQNYNSLFNNLKLPINNDLHLLLSASTFATAAPDIGKLWAGNMLGTTVTNGVPETVVQAWFHAGAKAYTDGETNHLVIEFRVAGWPDAFSEHITDINNTPGTGVPSDITKLDQTVYNNP